MTQDDMISAGHKNTEVAKATGLSIDQVKRLRKKLGLSRHRSKIQTDGSSDLFAIANKLMRPCYNPSVRLD